MDKFVEKLSCNDKVLGPASAMGYYDGNTATAMWNYAQFFAMSEYSWGTTFGPSTPGALNLVARNTLPGTLFPTRPNGKPPSASVQPRRSLPHWQGCTDALGGLPFGRVGNRVPGRVFLATKLRAPGVDGPKVVPQEYSLIAKNCA